MQNVRVRGSMVERNYAGIITIHQKITWDAPANHSIQRYVVKYQINGSSIPDTTMTFNNATCAILELNVTKTGAPISYTVQVAAVSEAGQGDFSDRIDFNYSSETNVVFRSLAANSCRLYTSHAGPGPPTGVTVQAESCHTLNVTWSPPDHTGGLPITGYNISYTDTRTSDMLYGYSSTTMKSLQQLKPGTQYIVRVRAMNAFGQRNFAKKSSGKTSERREYTRYIWSYVKPYKN